MSDENPMRHIKYCYSIKNWFAEMRDHDCAGGRCYIPEDVVQSIGYRCTGCDNGFRLRTTVMRETKDEISKERYATLRECMRNLVAKRRLGEAFSSIKRKT